MATPAPTVTVHDHLLSAGLWVGRVATGVALVGLVTVLTAMELIRVADCRSVLPRGGRWL